MDEEAVPGENPQILSGKKLSHGKSFFADLNSNA
jgi:hypothetical protein